MPTVYRAPSSPIPVGDEPWSVAVGQFNGDGYDDLAIVNNDSNNVTILLGNGTGGFAQASGSPITVANNPFSVAVGRFNGDGNDDLVVTSGSAPGNVRILLGNGNGTFSQAPGSPYTVGTGVTYGVVGSFNGDSHADLAIVTFAETLAVLLGDGSGGFTLAGPPAPIGSGPYQIVRSSFNGDSHDDLATVNYLDHSVRIWLGNGAGGFSEAAGSPIFVGFPPPSSMAIGNFNGDSHADFAVTYGGPGSLAIYLGNGSGGFSLAPGGPISVEYAPRALAVGNFNGDSHDDIAVPSSSSDYVTILLGNGSAGFSPAVESPVPTGDVPIAVAVGDFDGNSLDDLALANLTSDDVTILLGGCPVADLGVSVTDAADPSVPGGTITYTITVQNFGPDPAATVSLSHPLPAGTTFVSVAPPNGWHCAVPSVGGAGTVTCTIPYLPPGTSAFTLVVQVGAGVAAPGMLMTTTSVDAATGESAGGNNAFSVTTSLVAATATSTSSPTLTPTTTLTPTPTLTPGGTPFSATATLTPSPTATRTPTSTATPTPTPTPSPTPFASAPKDEKEDKQKETEQQQLQREHTNRSGIDDVATEGNVIAVDLTANPPTITIANRDGVVTLIWVGPPDQLPRVGPGDYVQVDGQKVTEQLYEITDLSVD